MKSKLKKKKMGKRKVMLTVPFAVPQLVALSVEPSVFFYFRRLIRVDYYQHLTV